ncbi:MAG: lipopolysaccharide assembly protein LapA domain-containing protein [Luteimonas sp.]
MRLVRWLIALLCLAAGAIVGALNAQPVSLDLGFTMLRATLGVCVLVALLLGVVVGGLVAVAGLAKPMRRSRLPEPAAGVGSGSA